LRFCLVQWLFHLFKGVSPKLVGHPVLDAMTLDDIARLYVVRQDEHLFAHGAACLLNLDHRRDAVLFAHPERKASSVGAVEDLSAPDPVRDHDLLPTPIAECLRHRISPSALADPEQALDPPSIKADDNLTVNNGDWGCPEP